MKNLPLVAGDEPDLSGKVCSQMLDQKHILIMLICAHCPFVKHIEKSITDLYRDYGQNVQFLAVSSNSLITHPQDGPDYLAKQAQKNSWRFPYLLDTDQSFAKSLMAACTPEFFIFSSPIDGIHKLCYRGQLDGSRPGNNIPVSGSCVREALDSLLQFKTISVEQKPSIGCNIKWHPGEEPEWCG